MSSSDESDEFSFDIDTGKPEPSKEGIVFLVDSTEPMFECYQFSLAIQCIINVMKNDAIASNIDEVGIILFGTKKTLNDSSHKHIYVFKKLQKISVESILALKNLNQSDFGSEFGHSRRFSLGDVFSLAISEFKQRKVKFDSKRVILFTCTSNPYPDDSEDSEDSKKKRNIAVMRAQNFLDFDIDCDLIPLTPKDGNFDTKVFYKEVLDLVDSDDGSNALEKLEPLYRRVYRKHHRSKNFSSILFRLGSNVEIRVKLYVLFANTKKPSRVSIKEPKKETDSGDSIVDTKISEVDSKIMKLGSQDVKDEANSSKLSSKDAQRSVRFGTEDYYYNKKDTLRLVQFEEPALTLLGFKDLSALQTHIHIIPGFFVFPDESKIKGSGVLFNALLLRCAQRNKVPICRLTLKSKQPRLVALFSQLEDKASRKPGGFNLVHLPFNEDIRDPEIKLNDLNMIEQEAIDLGVSIVDKLTFDFDSKKLPNPELQSLHRAIEALAMNEPIEPFDESLTQPNYEDIECKAGYNMYRLNQLLGGYKVQIATKPVTAPTEEFLRQKVAQDNLGYFSVAVLKEICRSKGIHLDKKRKEDCIQAIRNFYNESEIIFSESIAPTEEIVKRKMAQNKLGSFKISELKAFCLSKGIHLDKRRKDDCIQAIRNYYNESK